MTRGTREVIEAHPRRRFRCSREVGMLVAQTVASSTPFATRPRRQGLA